MYIYGWCKQKNDERNVIKAVVDNDGILWLNERYTEEELDQKNLWEIAIKYSDQKTYIWSSKKPKKQVNRIFIDGKLAVKVIMYCGTISAHKFWTRLGFKQCNVILTKEQSMLTKMMSH